MGSSAQMLLALLAVSQLGLGSGLLSVSLWDGTMPQLTPEDLHLDLQPDFALPKLQPHRPRPVMAMVEPTIHLAATVPDFASEPLSELSNLKPLNQAEKQLMGEGEQLWRSVKALRDALKEQPAMIAEEEGRLLLEDLNRRYLEMKKLSDQLANSTQPVLAGMLTNVEKALQPLQAKLKQIQKECMSRAFMDAMRPALSTALGSLQVVCGVAALGEILHVTNKIRASCTKRDKKHSIHRALEHMKRADADIVSAGNVLDRIVSDTVADRPVDDTDVNHFNVEQHDLAVQLANVRSQIETLRKINKEEVHRYGHWSGRWGVAGVLLVAAKNFVKAQAQGKLAQLAPGASLGAAVLNLVMWLVKKRDLGDLDKMQLRHDDAIAEHAGLHAQFSEVVKATSSQQAVPEGKPVDTASEGNKLGSGKNATAQNSNLRTALKDVASALGRMDLDSSDSNQVQIGLQALLPMLSHLAEKEDANFSSSEAQRVLDTAVGLLKDKLEQDDNPGRGDAIPSQDVPEQKPSEVKGNESLNESFTHPETREDQSVVVPSKNDKDHVKATPRPSRLRAPSVRPLSVTPRLTQTPERASPVPRLSRTPPLDDPHHSHKHSSFHRPSKLRRPSVAPSLTPPPVIPGQMSGSQRATPEAGEHRATPELPSLSRPRTSHLHSRARSEELAMPRIVIDPELKRQKNARLRTPGLRATRRIAYTPDPRSRTVPARDSSSDPEDRPGRKLEEQLLQLLLMRMEVTSDPEKRERLRSLASQLREATRLARQQAQASVRTEEVLRDCVDAELAKKILKTQREAAQRTQEEMRACIKETMEALEDEYEAKTELEEAAGMRESGDTDSKVEKILSEAKDVLAQGGFLGENMEQQDSKNPNSSDPNSRRESSESGSSGSERKSWKQFLARQAAASRSKFERRSQSAEATSSLSPKPSSRGEDSASVMGVTHSRSAIESMEGGLSNKSGLPRGGTSVTPEEENTRPTVLS